ncbi:MAG: hypothetical protein WBM90_05830 [Acidimicrobiia bacterium]
MSRNSHRAEIGLPQELGGARLVAAQTGWIVFVTSMTVLVATGFIRVYSDPMLVAMAPLTDLFVELGIDLRLMITIALALPYAAVVVIAVYVFWKRRVDSMALLFTATLVAIYGFSSRALLALEGIPILEHSLDAAGAAFAITGAFTLSLFPNGVFVPTWSRWLGPLMLVPLAIEPGIGTVVMTTMEGGGMAGWRSQLSTVIWVGILVVGMGCQLFRYRRFSTAEERQQTKLVVAPLCMLVVILLVALAVLARNPAPSGRWIAWLLFAAIPVSATIPIGVGAAIMRFRLFEVDRLISRTVTYGLVLAALGALYFGTVTLISWLLPSPGAVGVAASTLLVAGAFNPLRRRIRDSVDRRFNRSRQQAREIFEDFVQEIRGSSPSVVDLSKMLLEAANNAFQPGTSGVWVPGEDGRPDTIPDHKLASGHEPG